MNVFEGKRASRRTSDYETSSAIIVLGGDDPGVAAAHNDRRCRAHGNTGNGRVLKFGSAKGRIQNSGDPSNPRVAGRAGYDNRSDPDGGLGAVRSSPFCRQHGVPEDGRRGRLRGALPDGAAARNDGNVTAARMSVRDHRSNDFSGMSWPARTCMAGSLAPAESISPVRAPRASSTWSYGPIHES